MALANPKNDIYVGLLAIAFGALLIACALLALEMYKYEWTVDPQAAYIRPDLRTYASFDSYYAVPIVSVFSLTDDRLLSLTRCTVTS